MLLDDGGTADDMFDGAAALAGTVVCGIAGSMDVVGAIVVLFTDVVALMLVVAFVVFVIAVELVVLFVVEFVVFAAIVTFWDVAVAFVVFATTVEFVVFAVTLDAAVWFVAVLFRLAANAKLDIANNAITENNRNT